MRYLYCFAVVTSFVVQNNNNQLENSLTETLTTMVSLSLQMCPRNKKSGSAHESHSPARTVHRMNSSVEL